MDKFSRNLIAILEEKNMTQRALAQAVGVTEVTISRYINGSREPKVEIIAKIADVLDISSDYLLGRAASSQPQVMEGKDDYSAGKANKTLDISGLSDEDVKKVVEYVTLLKMKYDTSASKGRIVSK